MYGWNNYVDESGDEEEKKAEKPPQVEAPQASVDSSPIKTFTPPVRQPVPFKSAGNSAPKPTATNSSLPLKKPMGKPLSLIREKLAKVGVTVIDVNY